MASAGLFVPLIAYFDILDTQYTRTCGLSCAQCRVFFHQLKSSLFMQPEKHNHIAWAGFTVFTMKRCKGILNERILWNSYRGVTSQQTWKSFHVESKHRNHSASAMAKYLIQLDYEIYVTVAGSWRMTKSVTSYDKEAERPVLVVTW